MKQILNKLFKLNKAEEVKLELIEKQTKGDTINCDRLIYADWCTSIQKQILINELIYDIIELQDNDNQNSEV